MLAMFRSVSLLEGLSYLLILSVTAGFISRDYVSLLGMGHGVLFMLYLLLAMTAGSKEKWSVMTLLLVIVASLVPFAFIGVEIWLRKRDSSAALQS